MVTAEDIERLGYKYTKGKRITRSKAIKLYCKYLCCAGDLKSWQNCENTACFLWHFRSGKETLGNKSSFKKQRQNPMFSKKNSKSGGE